MNLIQRLQDDLKTAMKAGEQLKVDTLRFVVSSIRNKEKEKQGQGSEPVLTDAEVTDVIAKEAKKRKEAIALFEQGDRGDLAQNEQSQLEIIQHYLPTPLSEAEIEAIVVRLHASGNLNNFGALVKETMKEAAGRADGKTVSEIAKRILG